MSKTAETLPLAGAKLVVETGSVILDAQGIATRTQISAITQRLCEKLAS